MQAGGFIRSWERIQERTGIVFPSKPMEYEKYSKIFRRLSSRFSKAPYLPQGKDRNLQYDF